MVLQDASAGMTQMRLTYPKSADTVFIPDVPQAGRRRGTAFAVCLPPGLVAQATPRFLSREVVLYL